MTEEQTVAWIFYAVAGASGQEPADFRSISMVADGINHAVPTHKELQGSLSWLHEAQLVNRASTGYMLTPQGQEVMKSAQAKSNTTMGVWKELTRQLELAARSSNNSLKTDAAKPRTLG
jgi:hypothetical protein